jgi:glycosyltransferase involved in cell wall biosynthesis
VILGGVDTDRFSPREGLRRSDTVVFVGRLLPHKGIAELIDAMPNDPNLEVIGQVLNADYFAKLQQRAIGKRVAFRHHCDDGAIIAAYRAAACVVLPSVYHTIYGNAGSVPELLGQTLIEGMACGAPAICTDVASLPEVVEDGVTGFVVPPNDAVAMRRKIRWLCDHPQQAACMGQTARRRVLEKFSWPKVVHRCLEIYNS